MIAEPDVFIVGGGAAGRSAAVACLRTIKLKVDAEDLAKRLAEWKAPKRDLPLSWLRIYGESVSALHDDAELGGRK